jgi:prepilin peptidase CpaA
LGQHIDDLTLKAQLMEMVSLLLLLGLALALILAALMDVWKSRIPNWITFSLTGFGISVHGYDAGVQGILMSIEGVAVGLLCLIFFYIKGGMGAGDVKMLAAIGAITGPYLVVFVFGFTGVFGGMYSVAMLCAEGGLRHAWDRLWVFMNTLRWSRTVMLAKPRANEPKLRYALVLGLGTVLAEMLALYGMI